MLLTHWQNKMLKFTMLPCKLREKEKSKNLNKPHKGTTLGTQKHGILVCLPRLAALSELLL